MPMHLTVIIREQRIASLVVVEVGKLPQGFLQKLLEKPSMGVISDPTSATYKTVQLMKYRYISHVPTANLL